VKEPMSIDEKVKEVLALIGKVKVSRKPHSAECEIIDEFEAEGVKVWIVVSPSRLGRI